MSKMIKQILFQTTCMSLALYCFAASSTEVPKECTIGTPDYNDSLCNETCTKDVHVNQPYCANFTVTTPTTQSQPQHQEVSRVDTVAKNEPQEITRDIDVSKSEVDFHNIDSSGISLRSSLIYCVSCILFSITF